MLTCGCKTELLCSWGPSYDDGALHTLTNHRHAGGAHYNSYSPGHHHAWCAVPARLALLELSALCLMLVFKAAGQLLPPMSGLYVSLML